MRQIVVRINKRWGYELIIVNDARAGYCGKDMHGEPGTASRIERHRTKDETFLVLRGSVRLLVFGRAEIPDLEHPGLHLLWPDDAFRIPPGTWHRFQAEEPGTRFIEFSTFHDDADTERYEAEDASDVQAAVVG